MPQIIVRYSPALLTTIELSNLALPVRVLVAEVASTPKVPFTKSDIEWIPQSYENGTLAPVLALEIRTIGFPERKAKMNREAMQELKKKIMELEDFPESCRSLNSLIWVQFMDPDGVHV